MHSRTVDFLLNLNRQFYQTFALQFAQTRQRLQPGVRRLLPDLLQANAILDLGCGNGELARQLASQGYSGTYLGIDFSPLLLQEAALGAADKQRFSFLQADLADSGWAGALHSSMFDCIVAFSVLHHLPGKSLRLACLRQVRQRLSPSGCFMLSNWQFLNSPRLRNRLQPWERVGLGAADLEEGDYLMDWRRGGVGLRYVHHFRLEELQELAAAASFFIEETFLSDGEGGRLGLYQIWLPV